jgi:hypothetical protein
MIKVLRSYIDSESEEILKSIADAPEYLQESHRSDTFAGFDGRCEGFSFNLDLQTAN